MQAFLETSRILGLQGNLKSAVLKLTGRCKTNHWWGSIPSPKLCPHLPPNSLQDSATQAKNDFSTNSMTTSMIQTQIPSRSKQATTILLGSHHYASSDRCHHDVATLKQNKTISCMDGTGSLSDNQARQDKRIYQ